MSRLQVFWISAQEFYVLNLRQVNQCQRVHQENEEINWAFTWWNAYSLNHLWIIIINSYILVTSIKSTHEKLYAMCVEWTKLSEVENHSLSIRLLHAVKTTRLRLCIKFVRVDHMLKNECSSHFKLLQKLRFHHRSRCCSEIFRDHNDYSIV